MWLMCEHSENNEKKWKEFIRVMSWCVESALERCWWSVGTGANLWVGGWSGLYLRNVHAVKTKEGAEWLCGSVISWEFKHLALAFCFHFNHLWKHWERISPKPAVSCTLNAKPNTHTRSFQRKQNLMLDAQRFLWEEAQRPRLQPVFRLLLQNRNGGFAKRLVDSGRQSSFPSRLWV